MKRKAGGIGAVGSAKARFFHPSAKIRERWSNEQGTLRLSGVLVTGKATHRVNRKQQICYERRIPEIDDGTIFVISVNNFKVDEAASTPFPDEASPVANQETRATPSQAQAAATANTVIQTSTANIDSTLNAHALEVSELRQ